MFQGGDTVIVVTYNQSDIRVLDDFHFRQLKPHWQLMHVQAPVCRPDAYLQIHTQELFVITGIKHLRLSFCTN